MSKEEKHPPLTDEQKKVGRKQFIKIVAAGAAATGGAVVLSGLPKADASSLVTRGIQFTGGAVVASDGSNPGDYVFYVNSAESVAGRLKFWKGGVAYDVINNITDADIAAGAAISNSKIIAAAGDYDYLITKVGSNFTSLDRVGNVFGTPGTDAGPVIRAVLTKLVVTDNVSGRIVFDPRYSYDINTTGVDAAAGLAAYRFSNSGALSLNYALGIPNGTNPVAIELDGLVAPDFESDDAGSIIPTYGAIINLTTSIPGMTTLTGGNNIVGIWHLIPSAGFGNKVTIKNLRVRFPNNQRTNIAGIHMEYGRAFHREEVICDFNIKVSSLSVPPSVGTGIPNIGIGDIQSGHHDSTSLRAQSVGWIYGHDFLSEHLLSNGDVAVSCTYPFIYGGYTSYFVYHPSNITGFTDAESINGPVFGPGVQAGAQIFINGYDLEYNAAGPFARVNGAVENSESAAPIQGKITYASVATFTGITYVEFWKPGNGGWIDTVNLGFTQNISLGSGTYNVRRSDRVLYCDASGGNVTINLPPAADFMAVTVLLTIIKTDSSVNTVTITRAGADLIEGATTLVLTTQYAKTTLKARYGGLWYDLMKGGI